MQFDLEGETDNLALGLPEAERPAFRSLVAEAVAQAQAANLAGAAARLEAAHRQLVAHDHFRRCDNDIWSFVNLTGLVRGLSSETTAPAEYQRLLDAAPGPLLQEPTRAFMKFWYR